MVRATRNLTRKSMALLTSLLLVLFWVPGLIAASPAHAANLPSAPGGFEIEGNLLVDDTATPLLDWESVLSSSDPKNDNVNGDQTVFTEADKESDANSTWYQGTPPATPAKTDIGNVYSYTLQDSAAPHHEFYNFAWDRGASTGTDYYYLELNKKPNHLSTPAAGKTAISVPDRSDGDVRFKLHDQGSGLITLDTYATWKASTSSWTETTTVPAGAFAYGVSGVTTPGNADLPTGWTSPNATNVGGKLTFGSERFIETSFDLSQLGLVPACPSPGFATVNFRSTTGQSDTNLSDFIAPLNADIPSTCAQLHIRKYAGTTANDETAANLLAGATFTISPNPATGTAGSSVSVKDGQFTNLPSGFIADPDHTADGMIDITTAKPNINYTVTESAPPAGYLISGTDHVSSGVISDSHAFTFNFLDTLGSLTFYKVDAQDTGTPVGGASFLVHRVSGDGTQADVSVTDKTPSSAGSHDDSNVAGTMTVSGLKTGTYRITETTPLPSGYGKDNTTFYITIDQNHSGGFLSDDQGAPVSGTATFHDPRLPVTLRVIKTDGGACDPDAVTPSSHCLSGAVFKLFELSGNSPDIVADAPAVDTCTTDSTGSCSLTVAHWGGTYYWYEQTAPDGYNLPANRYSTTIDLSSYPTSGIGPDRTFADNRPTITTTATDAVIGHPITDSVTLGNVPAGAHGHITFTVYGPFATAAQAVAVNCIDANKAPVSGSATNPFDVSVTDATKSVSSGNFATSALGFYAWKAVYSGDPDVGGAGVSGVCGDVSGSNDEVSQVTKQQPAIHTQAADTNTVKGELSDTAYLTDYYGTPDGDVTFTLYKGVCGGTPYGTITLPIGSDGTVSTAGHTADLGGSFNADNTGTGNYFWAVSYSNDTNNKDVSEACGGTNETSHAPVLDGPHKYNDPGTAPNASTTDTTVSIYADNNVIHYTITVHNSGSASMNGVTVTDTLDSVAGPRWLSDYKDDCNESCVYDPTLHKLTWTFDLGAGDTKTLTFSVRVDPNDLRSDVINNQASVSNGGVTKQTENVSNPVDYPDLSINKCASPLPNAIVAGSNPDCNANAANLVAPGSAITYDLTVTNSGDQDATDVVVTDAVPLHTSFSSCPDSCTNSSGTVTWHVNVAAGGSTTVHFTVNVDPDATDTTTIDNTGSFTWSNSGGETADQSGTSATVEHLVGVPIISGDKTADPLPTGDPIPGTQNTADGIVHPGDTITYTITATNDGLAEKQFTITDQVPDGTTYSSGAKCDDVAFTCSFDGASGTPTVLQWTLTLPGNSSTTVSFPVTVNANDSDTQPITNFANVDNHKTREIHHEVIFPIINAVKSSDPAYVSGTPTLVGPNTVIKYTITVTNSGHEAKSGVVVTDAVPSGTTYDSSAPASCDATPNCTVDTSGLPGSVKWTLDMPAGSLESPAVATVSFSVITPNVQSWPIDNTATFTNDHTPGCVVTEANTCDTNTTHHKVVFPVVNAVKSSDPVSGEVNNPTTVTPGQTITYKVAVTNSGQADATNVHVSDHVPAGTTYVAGSADATGGTYDAGTNTVNWTLATLAKGATTNLTFQAQVPLDAVNGTLIDNTATFSNVHTPNCVPAGETSCSTNTTHHEVRFAVLTLAKSSDPVSGSVVQRGDRIDYTVTLTNTGLAGATKTITDTLPDHVTLVPGSAVPAFTSNNGSVVTWIVNVPAATVGEGGTVPGVVTLTYAVTVDNDAPEGATLTNVALIDGQCVGNEDESNCTTDHHVPTGALTLVKHVDKATASYGDTLTYTFTAGTTGALDQTNVVVHDVLPKGTAYVAGSAKCTDAGPCTTSFNSATKTVSWQLGDMAHGTSRHLVFKVTIVTPSFDPTVGLPPETIVNSGTILSTETPSTPSNQVVTKVVTVLGVKVVRPPKLPFTGVPAQEMLLAGLAMLGAGIILTSVRRRREQ